MTYESVIGQGRITVVPDSGKEHALRVLMAQYRAPDFSFSTAVIPRTTVLCLTVEHMTGKRPGEKARLNIHPKYETSRRQEMPAAAGLLSYCRKSADEIGECAHFRLRARTPPRHGGDAPHQPEQVARELAHGLHALPHPARRPPDTHRAPSASTARRRPACSRSSGT